MENGYLTSSQWPYGYSRFDNGVTVNLPLRRLYLDLDEPTRAQFGNPVATRGPNSFLDWATRPQAEEAGLSPFLLKLYELRPDVAVAFPDMRGKDRAAFLEWAQLHGCREMKYEPDSMRLDAAVGWNRAEAAIDGDASGSATANGAAAVSVEAGSPRLPPKHIRRYEQARQHIRELVRVVLPPEATVAVVSKGDDELLKLLELEGRKAWHFPQDDHGAYAGYYPADSAEAVSRLEALRDKGAQFLLFPGTALWWLEHYADFKQHLKNHYRVVVDQKDTCLMIALGRSEKD
jgi:hypothetical protein